jgi:hypothetical protein
MRTRDSHLRTGGSHRAEFDPFHHPVWTWRRDVRGADGLLDTRSEDCPGCRLTGIGLLLVHEGHASAPTVEVLAVTSSFPVHHIQKGHPSISGCPFFTFLQLHSVQLP